MAIVSVSLPDDLVAQMDGLVAQGQYKGRSEAVRTAVRHLLQSRHALTGAHIHGTITLLYGEGQEARVSEVRHAFHDVVLSMMHTHCEPEVCMDVLIVGGPAHRVQDLRDAFERNRFIDRAVLVPFTPHEDHRRGSQPHPR